MFNTDDYTVLQATHGIQFETSKHGGCVYDENNDKAYLSMDFYCELSEWI